jgi:hypothetical protein
MINIIIPCTPNYENRNVINTINKGIDIVTQFIVLYNSIKKNWKSFEYKINLFHNKDYPFNDYDKSRLSKLEIDIYAVEADYEHSPFAVKCGGISHKLKNSGTHRLYLDPDMIALNEPMFDLSCDWQAMYAGSSNLSIFNYINEKYGYNIDCKKYDLTIRNPYKAYMQNKNEYKKLIPHFNGGAVLVKESLCGKLAELGLKSMGSCVDTNLSNNGRHMGPQYGFAFSLVSLSENWKPFEPGFNYLLKISNPTSFGINNIKLVHYCGRGGDRIAKKIFKEEFEVYSKLMGS